MVVGTGYVQVDFETKHMPPPLRLYFDDTGSKHPDKKSDESRRGRDWFGLGGYIVREEDVDAARAAHDAIVKKWGVRNPFHMTDMLAEKKHFAWLGRLKQEDNDRFWRDYKDFLCGLPVIGTACIIDRPGYVARGYLEKHGSNKWLLCRSAFDILVERSVKYARSQGRKLDIICESDTGANETIRRYFRNLKANGLGFNQQTSEKYKPLSQEDFAATLGTLEWKGKPHPMVQIADSFIYTIARGRYEQKWHIYRRLRDAKRISTFAFSTKEEVAAMGVKYYCFELHDAGPENKKDRV